MFFSIAYFPTTLKSTAKLAGSIELKFTGPSKGLKVGWHTNLPALTDEFNGFNWRIPIETQIFTGQGAAPQIYIFTFTG